MRYLYLAVASLIAVLSGYTSAFAETITVMWNPNTEADMKEYRIYYCPSAPCSNNSISLKATVAHPNISTSFQVDKSGAIAMTAVDTSGNQSFLSNSIPFSLIQVDTTEPNPPTGIRVEVK